MALLNIKTRYHQPTSETGAFLRAQVSGESKESATAPYNYAYDFETNHFAVADRLAQQMGWNGTLMGADTDLGMVFIVPDKKATFEIGEYWDDKLSNKNNV